MPATAKYVILVGQKFIRVSRSEIGRGPLQVGRANGHQMCEARIRQKRASRCKVTGVAAYVAGIQLNRGIRSWKALRGAWT